MSAKYPYATPGDTVIEQPTLILSLTTDRKCISLYYCEVNISAIFTADEAEAFANALLVKVRRIRQLEAEVSS